jgi:flagellar basal body-associated protein FliL
MFFLIELRILIMLLVVAGVAYIIYREVSKMKSTERRKEALEDALNHIEDTITIGEKLAKVDKIRLHRAQEKIDNVVKAGIQLNKE